MAKKRKAARKVQAYLRDRRDQPFVELGALSN